MKFFALDLHIGIRDMQHIFEQLGHSLDVWSISDHHHIMSWPRAQVDVVNQHTWMRLDQRMCNEFYERYKTELSKYDGFVCFYPPAFSMIYEKFQKPIIVQVPVRYETPFFNDPRRWEYFNEYLRRGIDSGQLIPVVNNLYDQVYTEKFVGRKWNLIPSLCDYTGAQYTGKRNEFLYISKVTGLENSIRIPNLVNKRGLRNHSWQDVADYRAIVYIPYHNTLMSIFEQYSGSIPMLFPSHEFLLQLWKQFGFQGVMSELSFRQVFSLSPGSIIDSIQPDPNDYVDFSSMAFWSKMSDFYTMPHIQYFDSFGDLEDKLNLLDFDSIHAILQECNQVRRKGILDSWQRVIDLISL